MTPEEVNDALIRRFGLDEAVHTEQSYDVLTADVPSNLWVAALAFARDELGCVFFDWLTAVDELAEGYRVVAHVYAPSGGHHLLLRTLAPRESPTVPSAVGVYPGANWHERETYEMFGVRFDGHPNLIPLLLPDDFEGHPLRKEFVLAARAAKAWPGAKEPGESDHDTATSPSRRRMLPPGVPDPQEWGPNAVPPEQRVARTSARPARAAGASRPARDKRAPKDAAADDTSGTSPADRPDNRPDNPSDNADGGGAAS